jgi:hypothetical protein
MESLARENSTILPDLRDAQLSGENTVEKGVQTQVAMKLAREETE